MTARACMLPRLRRSVLGAWLATAYALAVLALALAPGSAAQAFGPERGAVLCSGAPVPDDGAPARSSVPLGDGAHCKGCAHNPVLAVPPLVAAPAVARMAQALAPAAFSGEGLPQGGVRGLPPSRAPPAA